jgi:ribosome-binding factor A
LLEARSHNQSLNLSEAVTLSDACFLSSNCHLNCSEQFEDASKKHAACAAGVSQLLVRRAMAKRGLFRGRNGVRLPLSKRRIMKHQPTKGPSQRQLRAGELIRHALAEILQTEDVRDADLEGEIVTIAEVRVSPDLKHATVFASSLGGKNSDVIASALNRHQRFLRGELARRVELKYAPELVFRGDHVLDEAGRIEELLRSPEVARDLK